MSLSWRGLVGLGTPEAEGLETLVVAAESKGKELRWRHIQRMLRDGISVSHDEDLAGETHPLAVRHDRVKSSPGASITPSAASSTRPPAPEPAPSVDLPSSAGLIWDELSDSELLDLEATSTMGPREATPPAREDAAAPQAGEAAGDGVIGGEARPVRQDR